MNRIFNANWKFVLDKVGTVVVDRRFWLKFVVPTFFAIGLFPQWVGNAEGLSDQAVSIAKLIVETAVPVVSAYLLSSDWTKRAPSGLNFKEIASQLATDLREAGLK